MDKKYFIYCRKSSEQEDRQILSLESQEKENLNIVEQNKLNIVGIYKESGSAHVIGRPLFNEMLSRIAKGEANGIVVWDESRIARNSLDGGKVIYMMDLGQITEIRTVSKFYLNTPGDKAWLNLIFTFTKKDSDDKSENVKRGLSVKADKGWLPSGAKPGYMNDKYAEKGNKTTPADPERFPLISKAWDALINRGWSVAKILKTLNEEWGYRSPQKKKMGGKPMCRSQIYLVFRDPFYYGEFEFPKGSGKWKHGNHEIMITKDDYDKAQVILGRKMAPRPHRIEFAYTGLMNCGECGARITAEEKWHTVCTVCKEKFTSTCQNVCPSCGTKTEDMESPVIRHYIHYHCTKRINPSCTQKSVEVHSLETQIEILLGQIFVSDRFIKWALKNLNELNKNEVSERNSVITNLQSAYSSCIKRLDNLTGLMISPNNTDRSLLGDDEFKKRKIEMLEEKQKLETQLGNTGKRIENWLDVVEDKFKFASMAKEKFKTATIEEKREIMFRISSDLKLFDKNLVGLLENVYEPLRKMTNAEPTIQLELEPKEIKDKYGNLESCWDQNPLMLPRVDSDHEPTAYK
jgi:site-specific DNA recombinase